MSSIITNKRPESTDSINIDKFNKIFEYNIKNKYLYKSNNPDYNNYINIKSITYQDIYYRFNDFLIQYRGTYFQNLSKDLQITIKTIVDIYRIVNGLEIKGSYNDIIEIIIKHINKVDSIIRTNKSKYTNEQIEDTKVKETKDFKEFFKNFFILISNERNILFRIEQKIEEYLFKIPKINKVNTILNDLVVNDIILYTNFILNYINKLITFILYRKDISTYNNSISNLKTNLKSKRLESNIKKIKNTISQQEFIKKIFNDFLNKYLYSHYKKKYDYLSKKYKDLPTRIQNINIIKNKMSDIKKIDINGSIFAEILMNQLITKKTFYLNLDNKSKYYKWLIYLKLGQLFINKNKDKIIEDIVTNIKKEIFNDINKVINLLITSKNLNKGVENLFGITKLTELEECKKLKELVEFNNIEELLKSENKLTIITNIISTIKLESLGNKEYLRIIT